MRIVSLSESTGRRFKSGSRNQIEKCYAIVLGNGSKNPQLLHSTFLIFLLDFSRFVKGKTEKNWSCTVVQLIFVCSEISRFALALVRRRIRRQVHFCRCPSACRRQVWNGYFSVFRKKFGLPLSFVSDVFFCKSCIGERAKIL